MYSRRITFAQCMRHDQLSKIVHSFFRKVKVKLSLCFNWVPRHEGGRIGGV